jgi:hypothetical protein
MIEMTIESSDFDGNLEYQFEVVVAVDAGVVGDVSTSAIGRQHDFPRLSTL